MPVITRSAARASKIDTKKTTTKRTSKQQNNLQAINNSTTKPNSKDPFPMEQPRRLIEWISLKDPPSGVIPNEDNLFAILQEICKLQACIVIARGRPRELSGIEWLIIEWRSSRHREEFLTSELFLKLNGALSHRSWSQEFAWPRGGKIISANPIFPPQRLYEVLTIYFPADLDQEAISSIEAYGGLPRWYSEDEEGPAENPWAGLKSQIRVWMDGTCEYQGQTARRLAFFITFSNEEGERLYKEKAINKVPGRPTGDVMVNFFEGLKDLGMIGYESLHVEFLEVVHYAPEDYVPQPPRPISPETMKRLDDDRRRAYEADDPDESL